MRGQPKTVETWEGGTNGAGTFVDPGREGEEVEEPETGTGAGVKLDAGTGASVEVEGNGSQEPESAVDAKT